MKPKHYLLTILLVALLLGVAGCTATPTAPIPPTKVALESEAPPASPTQEQALTEPAETLEAPTQAPTQEPVDAPEESAAADYCVDCHSDQQMLIDTAKPEEVVESENEGAG